MNRDDPKFINKFQDYIDQGRIPQQRVSIVCGSRLTIKLRLQVFSSCLPNPMGSRAGSKAVGSGMTFTFCFFLLFGVTFIASETTVRNYCIGEPCLNNGTCLNRDDEYECSCYGFKGQNCSEPNPCDLFPRCQNRGTCMVVNDTLAVCACRPGFIEDDCSIRLSDIIKGGSIPSGRYATSGNRLTLAFHGDGSVSGRGSDVQITAYDANIDACIDMPCENDGTCTDLVYDYRCECGNGYKGKNCTDPNPCDFLPRCQNRGTCMVVNDTYAVCACRPSFYADDCSIHIDCIDMPCENDGTCNYLVYGYQCKCGNMYKGTFCTEPDPCALYPCQNFGVCSDTDNGTFHCYCRDGFTGYNCSIDIDDCVGEPCKNGATCIDGPNSYSCGCFPGFGGANCTDSIDTHGEAGMKTGALVAISIVVILVVLYDVGIDLWRYYIRVNPEGYGRTENIRKLGNITAVPRRCLGFEEGFTEKKGWITEFK